MIKKILSINVVNVIPIRKGHDPSIPCAVWLVYLFFFGRFLSPASGTRLTECQQCGSSTYSTRIVIIILLIGKHDRFFFRSFFLHFFLVLLINVELSFGIILP